MNSVTAPTTPNKKTFKAYVYAYLHEFLELFVALSAFSLIIKREESQDNMGTILKFSFIFAFISVWLDEYDPRYRSSLRAGFIASIGSSVVSRV